jgi:hypothetical protein
VSIRQVLGIQDAMLDHELPPPFNCLQVPTDILLAGGKGAYSIIFGLF